MLRELTSRKSLTLYPNCLCEKTSSPNYRGSTVARDNRAAKRYSLAVGVCIGAVSVIAFSLLWSRNAPSEKATKCQKPRERTTKEGSQK